MKAVGLLLLGGFVAMNVWASKTHAMPQFKNAFMKKYVNNSKDDAFKDAAKKANCNICHVPGEEKKVRNDYGKALEKFTGGSVKADMDAATTKPAKDKIVNDAVKKLTTEGFKKAEEEKSPAGPTFGELIKDGKLPVPVPPSK